MLPPRQPRDRTGPAGSRRPPRPAGVAAPSIRTVVSVDGSRYHRWQAELLAYSHRRVGQPGPLTRLWSAWAPPTAFPGETVWAEPYSPTR